MPDDPMDPMDPSRLSHPANQHLVFLCPSCFTTAKVRHCKRCRWLICEPCEVLWDAQSGNHLAPYVLPSSLT